MSKKVIQVELQICKITVPFANSFEKSLNTPCILISIFYSIFKFDLLCGVMTAICFHPTHLVGTSSNIDKCTIRNLLYQNWCFYPPCNKNFAAKWYTLNITCRVLFGEEKMIQYSLE